jgi:hypothetical protein
MTERIIMVLEFKINSDKDLVFNFRRKDKILNDTLKVYKDYLDTNNYEVFYLEDNILACEKCYYLAFFEDDSEIFLEEEKEEETNIYAEKK